jgi:hypothetical protein
VKILSGKIWTSVVLAATIIISAGISFSNVTSTLDITHYEFGKIIINEKEYTHDIVIWPDNTITLGSDDMHALRLDDFEILFNFGLKKVVIGTGDEGMMAWDFSGKLKKAIKSKGIELVMMNTHELVVFLNNTKERNFITLVHLNC